MRLIHSYWTRPALETNRWGNANQLCKDIFVQALSCLYIKERSQKPEIILHTDDCGTELFSDIPYDDIKTTLNDIPEDSCIKIFSQGKYKSLQSEPIGTIHIDSDVFIRKDDGIDVLNTDADVIYQSDEKVECKYIDNRNKLIDIEEFKPLTDSITSVSCGVVGFNNQEALDEYIKRYTYYLNLISQPEIISKFDENDIPDLTVEQVNLDKMLREKNYSKFAILSDYWDMELRRKYGFEHLFYKYKYLDHWQDIIKKNIAERSPGLISKIEKKINKL